MLALAALLACPALPPTATAPAIRIETPMPAPEWALLERALLRANADAVALFFDRYFDANGYALCVERWGGDDGPDDASESFGNWPLLHALGASDDVRRRAHLAWEGHLRQYTLARTTQVPLALDGMYYREFPTQFDWLHHGEGLRPFFLQGLSEPGDPALVRRAVRYADFYNGTDPTAPNYDPKHRVIRSLLGGSRGPLLRPATALDWAGDPIEVAGRFALRHGETSYEQMLEHFRDYSDVIGDHPQNLMATSVGLNAFALTGDSRHKDWVVSYVDAWRERMKANNGIIPSNIGLDGTIGGAAGGKWYGGVYGWGFTVAVPGSDKVAHRNSHHLGLNGFGSALLLTGDQVYVDAWRQMIDNMNTHKKIIDGRDQYPTMHGDDGWYAYRPEPYRQGALEVYFWSMDPADRARLAQHPWLDFLDGRIPSYPAEALRRDLDRVRRQVAAIRADASTPDTRLSDDILAYDPVALDSLVELTLGGLPTGNARPILHCRLRYFDADSRRPGLPPDVAALVEKLSASEVTVTLVNLDPTRDRAVTIYGGAYNEHRLRFVSVGDRRFEVGDTPPTIELAAGCGATLRILTDRYAQPPSFRLPWEER
jgi:hypothetical protein